MKSYKKIILGFLSILVFTIISVLYINYRTIKIDVISFNDFHGAIESPNEVGASKFVYAIKQWSNPNTLVVSAGDNYNGEALSNLLYGKPVSDIFKEAGVIASAVGNHEFDWGIDKIKDWEDGMGAPFVSANIFSKNGKRLFKPYIIKKVNGVRIAFVGLTTQETKFRSDQNIVGELIFEDPVAIAENVVKDLKDQGVNIVVLLTHIGAYMDKKDSKIHFENDDLEKLTKINGVDAIITAHYHKLVYGKVNGIPVTQSMSKGKAISKMEFKIKKRMKKIKDVKVSKRILYKEKENGLLKDDINTVNIIKGYRKNFSPILNREFGILENDLKYEKYKKSPLGTTLCDILKKKTGSQIAVINGGAIKGELRAGPIKYMQIYEILPFNSLAIKFEMYGRDIKKLFSHGTRAEEIGYMQHSGLTVDGDSLILDSGEAVEDDRIYTITANDFMASGGDMYDFSNARQIERFGTVREIIIDGCSEFLK